VNKTVNKLHVGVCNIRAKKFLSVWQVYGRYTRIILCITDI